MSPGFDAASHELEAKLRDLRRLVSEMPFLTDEQDILLADLTRALLAADETAHTLRQSLLEVSGAPPVDPQAAPTPEPLFTVAHLELPETKHDPLPPLDDQGRLELLREMRDVAREMGLPFDGEDELAELEAQLADAPMEEILPSGTDLSVAFPGLRYLGLNGRLHCAPVSDGTWRLIIDERGRPEHRLRALSFATFEVLMEYVARLLVTQADVPDSDGPDVAPDDDTPGSSRIPVKPTTPPPARPGGAERTFEEALAAPRSV